MPMKMYSDPLEKGVTLTSGSVRDIQLHPQEGLLGDYEERRDAEEALEDERRVKGK